MIYMNLSVCFNFLVVAMYVDSSSCIWAIDTYYNNNIFIIIIIMITVVVFVVSFFCCCFYCYNYINLFTLFSYLLTLLR